MKKEHWQWLEQHLQEVNGAFEIVLSLSTPKEKERSEASINIYDTEDAFNDDFEGVYLQREYAFIIQESEGYAARIAGKYVSFRDLNYTCFRRHQT